MSFLENDFFLLAVTFGIFFFAKLLQKKTGLVLLNPILLTIAVLIIFLKMTHISYETYNKGGHLIEFWLRPAVVALNDKETTFTDSSVPTGRMYCRSYFSSADSQTHGSFAGGYSFTGSKVRHYADCHGSNQSYRRYSVTHCGCRGCSRLTRRYLRF